MQAQQLSVKVFARQEQFDQAALIPVFHAWIRENRLSETLLIDVADYRHVPKGPGVMLIAHEAHYGLDQGGGRLGLLYRRKRDPLGDAGPKLEQALRAALDACDALQSEPSLGGKLTFDVGCIEVQVVSRLVAHNDQVSYEALQPVIADVAAKAYGGADVAIEHVAGPRQPLTALVRAVGDHDLRAVRARL